MVGKKAVPGTGRRRITNAHEALPARSNQNRGALAAVEEYVLKNAGAHLWASDIMSATDLPKRAVQAAMGDLIRRGGYASRITVLRPGNAWRLKEDAPTEPWDPEAQEGEGKWDPEASPPAPGKPRSSLKLADVRVVGEYPDGSLALDVGGKPYLARPFRA